MKLKIREPWWTRISTRSDALCNYNWIVQLSKGGISNYLLCSRKDCTGPAKQFTKKKNNARHFIKLIWRKHIFRMCGQIETCNPIVCNLRLTWRATTVSDRYFDKMMISILRNEQKGFRIVYHMTCYALESGRKKKYCMLSVSLWKSECF